MKNNLLYMFIFFGLIFASCEKEDLAITKAADFVVNEAKESKTKTKAKKAVDENIDAVED